MYQVNEDLSIYVTRGDIVSFTVTAKEDAEDFLFTAGSVLRLKVFEKKACDNVVLQKDFPVQEDTQEVDIYLEEKDTRIGGVISKPVDYWYEIELNPFNDPQTIIGYDDEDGVKIFKLFPEGRDLTGDIEPEDIPIVDKELDMTSERPIQNQAVARRFTIVEDTAKKHYENTENPHKVTAEQLGALKRSGGTMTGPINMGAKKITNLPKAEADGDALQFGQAKEMFPNFGDFEGKADTVQRASGSQITVDNSAHTPLKGLSIYGQTAQLTTTGKQLLKNCVIGQTKTGSGITFTANDDGSITINGTSTAECYWIIDEKTPITNQGTSLIASVGGAVDGVGMVVGCYLSDGSMLNSIVQTSQEPDSFEYPPNSVSTRTFIYVSLGRTINNVTIYPMIRPASITDDTYEPYSGGKSSPSLEYPQELESVGKDGSVNVTMVGANLLPYPYVYGSRTVNGVTCIQNPDGSITLDGTATSTIFYNCVQELVLPDGIYSLADFGSKDAYYMRVEMIDDEPGSAWQRGTFTVENGTHVHIEIRIASGAVFDNVTIYPMVNAGETALPWTPYTAQIIPAQTPNGLPGIPVMDANHATYTDENGQMWLADEIDYGRGVYVQRVKKRTLTEADISYANSSYAEYGTYAFTTIRDALDASSDVVVISDKLFGICADYRTGSGYDDKYRCYAQSGVVYLRFPAGTGEKTLEECKAAFAGVNIQYALAEPIELPLSEAELFAFEKLHTQNPNTTVYNDANAYMELDYYTPNTPVQMDFGAKYAGKILYIDENGNVVPLDGLEKFASNAYGLGGLSTYSSDPSTVSSNGFYYCDEDSYGIEDDFKEAAFLHMNRSETEMAQLFVNTLGQFGVRRFLAGQWGDIKGFAPSGYGLGTLAPRVENLDTLLTTGVFSYAHDAVGNPVPGYAGIVLCTSSATGFTQKAYPADYYGASSLERTLTTAIGETAYQPWGWKNPPMKLGVEYRTTERYNGNVVYAKSISISGIGVGKTRYNNLASPVTNLVYSEFNAYASGKSVIYRNDAFGYQVDNMGTTQALSIETNTQLSGVTGVLTVKYTKD